MATTADDEVIEMDLESTTPLPTNGSGQVLQETPLDFQPQPAAPADQPPPAGASPVPAAESAEDIPMITRESRSEKVMEWMESHYPVLAEVFETTQTVDSFHLAEENKEEFPHDDAVKVTKVMADKLLINDDHDQQLSIKGYLKSMFLCVTPESLTPLATLMYQRFEETRPMQMHMVFQYEDAKKVVQLCICLFVRGLLSDEAQQICDNEEVQSIMEDMINKELEGAPERLLAVSKTAEELERSLYSAYRGWRKIPQTDAKQITEPMVNLLKETDEERKEFLESLFYSLDYHSMLPLVVTMFQKYREVCPDKPGLLKGWCKNWNVSDLKFLGRVLVRRNILTKEEYDKFISKELTPEKLDRAREIRRKFERHDLCDVFDKIWEEEPIYGCDLLNYQRLLPYDDAFAISSEQMLPFLNGDQQRRNIYLKTMNNLSHPKKFWLRNVAVATKKYAPGDESLIGEYSNVAVIMCQQYMDRFPESYSELEEAFSPQYMYLFIMKCLWQWNVLSEVAMGFCVQSILRHQRDELTISHGLIPLLCSLPTTVYMPALVMSEASDFSESIWIQSFHDFNQSSLMEILVAGAIAREEKSQPNNASYQVLVKAIKNRKSSAMKVELILDVLLPQLEAAQPQDCDLWDPPECKSGSDALYLLAARRGSQFINVTFKLLEYLERNFNYRRHKKSNLRVMQLINDEAFDDYIVANIISKMVECKTIAFDNSETAVELAKSCSSYKGKTGSRALTATMLWKSYSHLLNILDVLSVAKHNEDVPLAILEEFNIYLYSNQSKAEKCSNALHVAARRGCTKFVVLALDRGFAKLLEYSNEEDQLPVHVALQYKKYGTAAVMLRAMNDYTLCLAEHSPDGDMNSPDCDSTTPGPLVRRVNFRELLDQLKKVRERLDQLKKEKYLLEKEKKRLNQLKKEKDLLEKEKEYNLNFNRAEDLQDCVMAILESTVDRDAGVNHHEVLEVDYNGNTPNKEDFDCPPMHSIEFIMRHLQDIIDHESFQSLVNCKWKLYGWKLLLIPFVIYLFFLAFLTTAFVLGATKSGSPSEYSQLMDGFRLFFEILVFLLILIYILFEIIQFCRLDIIAIFLTLLIIPFRIADHDWQWVFVALAYILYTLRIFKYAAINSSFAVYVKTLFQIIKQDIVQFLIVFIVITVSFGGGLYFSLRADTCRLPADRMTTDEVEFSPVTNTSLCLHPDETSEIYLSWLTGFRLLIEGNVINSYIFGDRGFWWFSVMIYMVFLFLVAVVMLSLLIAQFNQSYVNITKSARKTVTPDRAKILVDQQSTRWIRLCCRIFRSYKRDKIRYNIGSKFMSAPIWYRPSSPYKKSDDETVNDFEKIHKQLSSSNSTDQKQFKELQAQLKEVKAKVQFDMTSQSEVVKELQSEVTALRKQTEIVVKSLGEMKDILQQVLQK